METPCHSDDANILNMVLSRGGLEPTAIREWNVWSLKIYEKVVEN